MIFYNSHNYTIKYELYTLVLHKNKDVLKTLHFDKGMHLLTCKLLVKKINEMWYVMSKQFILLICVLKHQYVS